MSQSTEISPGQASRAFERAAAECGALETTVAIDFADASGPDDRGMIGMAPIEVTATVFRADRSCIVRDMDGRVMTRLTGATLVEAMTLAAKKYGHGNLNLAAVRINAKFKHPSLTANDLKQLAVAAWCDAFGIDCPSEAQLKELAQAAKTKADSGRQRLIEHLRSGKAGIDTWNKLGSKLRTQHGALKKVDLSNLNLTNAHFCGDHQEPLDMQGSNFENSVLVVAKGTHLDARKSNFKNTDLEGAAFQAKLHECDFSGASLKSAYFTSCILSKANFTGANLQHISFFGSDLSGANFSNADLTDANMTNTDLRGADFSSANMARAHLQGAKYDENSRFPQTLEVTGKLKWSGKGADPLKVARAKTAAAVVAGDFESFMRQLKAQFDQARVSKSIKMLKAERFSLFADIKDETLMGIVRSQTDAELVYSCRITNEGAFACCTQNLFPCGGLRGALCKHLLVLLIGLTKAGQLNPTRAHELVMASTARTPELDKEIMSETFLRYQGAQAGQIDWRPTETIPEDYYAF